MNVPSLFHPLSDHQLFNDTFYWEVPEDDSIDPKPYADDFEGMELRKDAKKNQVDPEAAEGLM